MVLSPLPFYSLIVGDVRLHFTPLDRDNPSQYVLPLNSIELVGPLNEVYPSYAQAQGSKEEGGKIL